MTTDRNDELIFVNRFTLAHGDPERFIEVFDNVAKPLQDNEALRGFTLVQSLTDPLDVMNIAEWTSEAELRRATATDEFTQHARALQELATSAHTLYRPRLRFRR
ncbi:antibiotic biosynthesis monooxygenase [Enemella evansiae]|uniref:antibiotic biosynthesis monooxygenase family protein n=1 Tax=Enemella evansiae TaxID=2016499 RepID=UPI000B97C5FF|nr:antibiotic biosynthesis monooxygenase family protein [Enemella evansiae]OYO15472.1 antibiotic biosynthesis monooxygenase [Enemella evansiae]